MLKEEYKSYVSNIPSVSGNDFPALLNYCVTILNILCCIRRLTSFFRLEKSHFLCHHPTTLVDHQALWKVVETDVLIRGNISEWRWSVTSVRLNHHHNFSSRSSALSHGAAGRFAKPSLPPSLPPYHHTRGPDFGTRHSIVKLSSLVKLHVHIMLVAITNNSCGINHGGNECILCTNKLIGIIVSFTL